MVSNVFSDKVTKMEMTYSLVSKGSKKIGGVQNKKSKLIICKKNTET